MVCFDNKNGDLPIKFINDKIMVKDKESIYYTVKNLPIQKIEQKSKITRLLKLLPPS